MFSKTVVLSLLLSSLCACVEESSYLVTAAPGPPPALVDAESQRGIGLRYTSNPAAAANRNPAASIL